MKMQNVIRAERSGVIKSITAAVGDTLQADDIIIEFED
jgi:propionyl-CoA carboxylase alpha chain